MIAPGQQPAMFTKLMTPADVAEALQMSKRTVFARFIKTGAIPSKRYGARSYRVRPCDFNEWVARGATGFRHVAPK